MKRKPLRIKKRRAPLWKNTVFLLFFIIPIVIGMFSYGLLYSDAFSLQDIVVEGASSEKYRKTLRDIIYSSSFPPGNNILFIPVGQIMRTFESSFPEIRRVMITRNFFQRTVTLRIIERKAIALFCQEQGSCVSLDEEGVAVRKEDDRALLPLIINSGTENLMLGNRVFDESLLHMLLDFKKSMENWLFLQEQDIEIFSFIPEASEKVIVRFSEGWVLFINPKEDMAWQKEKLMQVLEKQIPSEKRNLLEYIDVRFGDHAYVKYQ